MSAGTGNQIKLSKASNPGSRHHLCLPIGDPPAIWRKARIAAPRCDQVSIASNSGNDIYSAPAALRSKCHLATVRGKSRLTIVIVAVSQLYSLPIGYEL